MSIASGAGKEVIFKGLEVIAEVKEVIFPISLISATMQDGGSRERRDVILPSCIVVPNSELANIFYISSIKLSNQHLF